MKSRPLFLVLLLSITAMSRAASDKPPVVPVYEEPRHRLVFEKGHIRIFNTSIPPGDTSLFHFHENPTLYVMLNGARMRNQNLGEEWTEPNPDIAIKNGAFVFRDYHANPQTHRVDNIGRQSFQVIGVINSGEGKNAVSALSSKPEVENQWFNGYRYTLAAGESTATHKHDNPVLIVQVSDGHSNVIERGVPGAEKTVVGTWSIHEGGIGHSLNNLGSDDVELVEIEMK